MPIPEQRHVRLAIKQGNEVIKGFKQHSTGRLNLWVSITDLSQKYNITVEAQSRINPGITTAIVGQLPFWDIPVLTHAFPKDKLFSLRQKYGSKIIRDDIVRKS